MIYFEQPLIIFNLKFLHTVGPSFRLGPKRANLLSFDVEQVGSNSNHVDGNGQQKQHHQQ